MYTRIPRAAYVLSEGKSELMYSMHDSMQDRIRGIECARSSKYSQCTLCTLCTRVWDLRRRRIVQRLRGHTNNDALAMVVEPANGERAARTCAAGADECELRVWDLYRAGADRGHDTAFWGA